jgi:hypothetical protein
MVRSKSGPPCRQLIPLVRRGSSRTGFRNGRCLALALQALCFQECLALPQTEAGVEQVPGTWLDLCPQRGIIVLDPVVPLNPTFGGETCPNRQATANGPPFPVPR